MSLRIIYFFTVFLTTFFLVLATSISFGKQISHNRLIVWNVGQGSWATVANKNICFHFDVGGEFASFSKIKSTCGNKKNIVFYSHWDWDHINLSQQALKHLPNLCIKKYPRPTISENTLNKSLKRKLLFLKKTPFCPEKTLASSIKEIYFKYRTIVNKKAKKRNANSHSRIFTWDNSVLIPGDSGKKDESLWSLNINNPFNIKTLITGHHGSLTSTSKQLLSRLPNLKTAVVSARYKRYKHPHPKVIRRLKNKKVSVIDTETWGNLFFEL